LVTYADLKTAPGKDAAASKAFLMCRLLHIDRQRTKGFVLQLFRIIGFCTVVDGM